MDDVDINNGIKCKFQTLYPEDIKMCVKHDAKVS